MGDGLFLAAFVLAVVLVCCAFVGAVYGAVHLYERLQARRRERLAAEAWDRAVEADRVVKVTTAPFRHETSAGPYRRGASAKAEPLRGHPKAEAKARRDGDSEQPSTVSPLLAGVIGYELGRSHETGSRTEQSGPKEMPEADGKFGGAGASESWEKPSDPSPAYEPPSTPDPAPSYESPSFTDSNVGDGSGM